MFSDPEIVKIKKFWLKKNLFKIRSCYFSLKIQMRIKNKKKVFINNQYKLIISARGKLFFTKSKFFLEKMSSFLVKLHLLLWKFCPKIAYILGPLCAIGPKMLQFLQHYGIKITYVNI